MKPILKSKTFWFNVIAEAANYGGYLPQKYAIPVVAVANIILRFLTKQPVSVTGS